MKKSILLLCLCLCLLLGGCNSKIAGGALEQAASIASEQGQQIPVPDQPIVPAADAVPTVLDQMEYVLYQNIFFNDQAGEYVGKTFTKRGTFIRLEDRWNNVTRYYVWGYMDATKCCDWQWEFVPDDPSSLPPNGSLVIMTGRLEHNENALDKYWYVGASVQTETRYEGPAGVDMDLSTMDATLERVQYYNLLKDPDRYNGKTVCIYGRIKTTGAIQHPYYDNYWELPFTTSETVPAIGTMVLITGTWSKDRIENAAVQPTPNY